MVAACVGPCRQNAPDAIMCRSNDGLVGSTLSCSVVSELWVRVFSNHLQFCSPVTTRINSGGKYHQELGQRRDLQLWENRLLVLSLFSMSIIHLMNNCSTSWYLANRCLHRQALHLIYFLAVHAEIFVDLSVWHKRWRNVHVHLSLTGITSFNFNLYIGSLFVKENLLFLPMSEGSTEAYMRLVFTRFFQDSLTLCNVAGCCIRVLLSDSFPVLV